MRFFQYFKNKFQSKSNIIDLDVSTYDGSFSSSLVGLSDGRPAQIYPRTAYYLSERNADLGDTINKISSSVSSLERGIQRTADNVLYDHPFLSFLNNPSASMLASQFWREITESYLLTQEIWLVARGNINREPLALEFVRPYDVTVIMDDTTGTPSSIQTTSSRDRRIYTRVGIGRNVRYIDNLKMNEIFVIRGALSLYDDWRGRSPLSKLFYDIVMNTDGKRHNVSLLRNGMRTTGIMSPAVQTGTGTQTKWTGLQVKDLEDNIRAFHQGPGNSGNWFIVGSPTKIEGLNQTNKDMDYLSLLQNSRVSIYNAYNIPLPLMLAETMTLDNYTVANRSYYLKAVFPVFEQIASGLIQTLGRRFKINPNEKLVVNEIQIRDMLPVLAENMEILNKTQSVEKNEVRRVGGYEPVEGGDVILVSANLIPLGSAMVEFPEMGDEEEEPEEEIIDEIAEEVEE
jgi:HK97 family phage portal protein